MVKGCNYRTLCWKTYKSYKGKGKLYEIENEKGIMLHSGSEGWEKKLG